MKTSKWEGWKRKRTARRPSLSERIFLSSLELQPEIFLRTASARSVGTGRTRHISVGAGYCRRRLQRKRCIGPGQGDVTAGERDFERFCSRGGYCINDIRKGCANFEIINQHRSESGTFT